MLPNLVFFAYLHGPLLIFYACALHRLNIPQIGLQYDIFHVINTISRLT